MMSHSGNPTINSNNVNVYLESVNGAMQNLDGPGNLPAGTPVPVITQKALGQMRDLLTAKWPTLFPGVALPASNNDSGYFGPWTAVVAGNAVPCVVQQIQGDFSAWGLPLDGDTVPSTITEQVTQHISSQGGQAGFTSGTFQLTSSESLYWAAGYATVAISQNENGVLYVFAANAQINI